MSGILRFIDKISVQDAVYWADGTADGYGGVTYAEPVEFKCRWDDTIELITNMSGEQINSTAKILTNYPIKYGGYVYLGTLDDIDSALQNNPREIEEAFLIQKVERVPLIKSNTNFVQTVYL